jgi:hypothetical protein
MFLIGLGARIVLGGTLYMARAAIWRRRFRSSAPSEAPR